MRHITETDFLLSISLYKYDLLQFINVFKMVQTGNTYIRLSKKGTWSQNGHEIEISLIY